jgi:hypothetical protein
MGSTMIETVTMNTAVQDFVLTSEAARIIGVSPATVQLYERTGRLVATKTSNGTRLFLRQAVEAFARQREARRATSIKPSPAISGVSA